ncbi:MAG: hypothetical protein ACO2Y3_05000 [Methylophilaceae bacterium]
MKINIFVAPNKDSIVIYQLQVANIMRLCAERDITSETYVCALGPESHKEQWGNLPASAESVQMHNDATMQFHSLLLQFNQHNHPDTYAIIIGDPNAMGEPEILDEVKNLYTILANNPKVNILLSNSSGITNPPEWNKEIIVNGIMPYAKLQNAVTNLQNTHERFNRIDFNRPVDMQNMAARFQSSHYFGR